MSTDRHDPPPETLADDHLPATGAWPDAMFAGPRLWLSLIESTTRNLDATLQASLILGRGLGALDMTWRGLVCKTIEEEMAAARARAMAIGPLAAFDLEAQLTLLRCSRQVANAMLFWTIAMQVVEDAAVPIVRRAGDAVGGGIAAVS